MGATFDENLLSQIGAMIGQEAKRKRVHVVNAPTVCIQRSPLVGRGFEAFTEDPFLSGMLASSFIKGMQDLQVGSCIKHFAAHDQSSNSTEDDVVASERTLREVHMLPFQLVVKNANPWAFMTAYNKINGLHASENPWLIQEVLRNEWKWDGLVLSDWGGVYSCTSSINAGLDLEMPGPGRWRGVNLECAVTSGKVSMDTLDTRVRNMLKLVAKARDTDDSTNHPIEHDTPEGRALCRKVAAESIVLLKNQAGHLPLDKSARLTYGLIGDHWMHPAASGGGSADLPPYYVSHPLTAMKDAVGAKNVGYEPGCNSFRFTPLLQRCVTVPQSTEQGYILEWFAEDPVENPSQTPLHCVTTTDAQMVFLDNVPDGLPSMWFMRARANFSPEKTTKYRFGLSVTGIAKLFFDGNEIIDQWTSHDEKTDDTPLFNFGSMERYAEVAVEQGREYEIVAILKNASVLHEPINACGIRIGGSELAEGNQALEDAVTLAKKVDIPIILTGLSSDWECEASDRRSLELPNHLNELIARVAEANPNTVVITQSGLPITMPWINSVNSVMHAWYGGQETGNAIVDVLFGRQNPSGKLSLTFPKRVQDNPAFLTFGKADKKLYYGEGVFVGYRYYEMLDLPPLFYFGFGLSYTSFHFSKLQVPDEFVSQADHIMVVTVDIRNVGGREGAEAIQVYVSDIECSIQRPMKELKAFAKVKLSQGEHSTIKLKLDKYAVSFWSEAKSRWLAEAGDFEVIIATSADPKDVVLRKKFRLEKSFTWRGI